jgi:hypothetical protein
MKKTSAIGLRVVLILAGIVILFTGVNTAFGGMLTLGWQGQTVFFEVTDEHSYLVQDSHIRFLGGLWTGIGLLFIVASSNVERYQSALKFAFVLIFLGGLARFTQMQLGITFGKDIVGSLVAELVGMPLLYFWLSRTVKRPNS